MKKYIIFLLLFIAVIWLTLIYVYETDVWDRIAHIINYLYLLTTILILWLWYWKFILQAKDDLERKKIDQENKRKRIVIQLRTELEQALSNIELLNNEVNWSQCEFHNIAHILSPCHNWCWEKEQDIIFDMFTEEQRISISNFYKSCYEIDRHLEYAKQVFYSNIKIKNEIFYKFVGEKILNDKDIIKPNVKENSYEKLEKNWPNFYDVFNLIKEDQEFQYDCTNHSMYHLISILNNIPTISIWWVLDRLKTEEEKLISKQ